MTSSTDKAPTPVNRYIHGGYLYDANGKPVNIASIIDFYHRYSLTNETINNGAFRASKRVRAVPASAPYYIGVSIPAGRELVIFNRDLELSQGDYDVDVVTTTDGWTGGAGMVISTLKTGNSSSFTGLLRMGVTPVGTQTVQDEGLVDTGTAIGSGTAGGASAIEGVVVVIRGDSMIKVTPQDNSSPYNMRLRLICWERDID